MQAPYHLRVYLLRYSHSCVYANFAYFMLTGWCGCGVKAFPALFYSLCKLVVCSFLIYKQNYELLCSLWRWIYSVKFYIEYCIIYKLKYMLMKLCIIIVISQWQSVCLSFVEMLKTLRGTDIYQYLLKTCCFKLGLNKICENYVGNAFWHIQIHTEEGGMRFIKCIFCMKVIILQFMLVVNYRHFY